MTTIKLDKYESSVLSEYESNDFLSTITKDRRLSVSKIAENTFKKDKKINIRISNRDLVAIQKKALEEGMPYQTLVSNILHKFISGKLQDIRG